MDWTLALILLLGLYFLFMALGLPVGFSFLAVNIVGSYIFLDGHLGLIQLIRTTKASLTNITLVPIPLFILMGELLFHTGVALRAIKAIDQVISRVPGRLSILAIAGGTLFSSLSGSTIANTAVLGSMLTPDMLRRGYHPSMATGPVMAVGGIAMLIPPSALTVFLGSISKISVEKLLLAGIMPGLAMAVLFVAYVVVRCSLNPALAPSYEMEQAPLWQRWRTFVVDVVPLGSIFAVVVGGMFAGLATPSEAAALGCLAAVVLAAVYGNLTYRNLARAMNETVKVTVMIFFIVASSIAFSQIMAFSGATTGFLQIVETLHVTPFVLVLIMVGILILLGMVMDQISMVMVTIPFFIPLAQASHINLVWLGILILLTMEISLLTPPMGILLYVMKGVSPPEITMGQILRACVPFVVLECVVLALILIFPNFALFLAS